jgi:hypothetical protein
MLQVRKLDRLYAPISKPHTRCLAVIWLTGATAEQPRCESRRNKVLTAGDQQAMHKSLKTGD